jgi:hypothetical protein
MSRDVFVGCGGGDRPMMFVPPIISHKEWQSRRIHEIYTSINSEARHYMSRQHNSVCLLLTPKDGINER